MGWAGPVGSGVGVATFAVALVAVWAIGRGRPAERDARRTGSVAVAAGLGAGAALIGAFVAGASIGL
jgi:hypothetical protein